MAFGRPQPIILNRAEATHVALLICSLRQSCRAYKSVRQRELTGGSGFAHSYKSELLSLRLPPFFMRFLYT